MKQIILILILAFPLLAFSFKYDQKSYSTGFTTETPVIDGNLDDACWTNVSWGTNFTQFEPNSGEKPGQQTAFKIIYDNNYIYVAIRCYDSSPDLIDERLCRRDGFDGDMVGILFDSYYDKRTAFMFSVNAGGVKNDLVFSNDGNNEDQTWDPIWFVETNIDNEGWTAEMKIPLSQLRFNPNSDVWGLNLIREIYRTKETSTWQPVDSDASGFISQFGELSGIKDLETKRQIEIAPYLMSGYSLYEAEEGNPFADGKDFTYNAGLDGKIGITNDFTLDFTINPDFGQVEADPSNVNLSAFETYFSEKRPFFIENKNITSFNLSFRAEDLFYSRRIGRSPQYYPEIADDEFLKMPENTKILGALKFSGKSQDGWSVGIIETVANQEFAKIANSDGDVRKESVEPLTNYFIARLQKDLNKGETMIGGIVTSTYRDINNENLLYMNKTATATGIDVLQYFYDKKYYISAKAVASHITGTPDAMTFQQTSPQRYFQRPNADYVEVDSNLTSMTGTFGYLEIGKSSMKGLRYQLSWTYRSPSFELNDVGFLRNADNHMEIFWIGYNIAETKGIFRQLNLNFSQWAGWNSGFNYQFLGFNTNFSTQFKNLWFLWGSYEYNFNSVDDILLRGGSSFKTPSITSFNLGMNTNYTKKLTFSGYGTYMISKYNYYDWSRIGITVGYRPIDRLSMSINANYSKTVQKLQFIDHVEMEEDYYILSSIEQNTVNFTFRFDFNITPDLTIQYYGAPFVSAGNYYDFKNVLDPMAEEFDQRYTLYNSTQLNSSDYTFDFDENSEIDYELGNPDFNFQQFRSNLVFRWEYKPGSVLFLVWAHEQTDVIETGEFNFVNDFSNLFKVTPADRFIIKFQYRFT
ncbi:MAG: carbohydrate binding family 9 domain-containing protein [Bacteroidales bacterium]|nr:carbohydrate binding family 9 domain-containing protein [Bacteroidales bacterium]